MKRLSFTAILLTLLAFATQARAQYSIDWYTIDGGGGTSSGGAYSVTGTIGQPDAGSMSGGNFAINGGFWSLIQLVQTPGAPTLSIEITATNSVLVYWPTSAVGFQLQSNAALGNTNWNNVATSPQVIGARNQVTVTPPIGNKFFRLFKP